MFLKIICVVLFTILQICKSANRGTGSVKLIIDNDAGGDDAIAIFLALLNAQCFNGPEVVALTTGKGNTAEDNVAFNNQRILKVAGREDVPIYRGSKAPLVGAPPNEAWYGSDGLGDVVENATYFAPVQEGSAVLQLVELSKAYEGQLIVLTIGTLTNVALAIKLDPEFLGRLSQLYVAAGHIQDKVHSKAEFNANMDVEAYHIVMQHATPDKVTVLPFSQTITHLNYTKEWRRQVLGGIDNDIVKAMNRYERVALMKQTTTWASLDPSAVAMVVRPNLVKEYRYSQNDIVLCGDRRGITTNEFLDEQEANVRIIYSMKKKDYQQFLLDVFNCVLTI